MTAPKKKTGITEAALVAARANERMAQANVENARDMHRQAQSIVARLEALLERVRERLDEAS